MKKLFTLLIIWLSLTIYLAYDSLKFKQFKEENVYWRSFLIYSSSLAGCMTGVQMADNNYEFLKFYFKCVEYSQREKNIYEKKWVK